MKNKKKNFQALTQTEKKLHNFGINYVKIIKLHQTVVIENYFQLLKYVDAF